MSTTVLPAAASLTTANASVLDMSYNQDWSAATSGQMLVLVLGLAVAGALLSTQVFLAARFRRLVNPALAMANGAGRRSGHRGRGATRSAGGQLEGSQTRRLRFDPRTDAGPRGELRRQCRRDKVPSRPGPRRCISGRVPA